MNENIPRGVNDLPLNQGALKFGKHTLDSPMAVYLPKAIYGLETCISQLIR